jgi:hypothetical protein
LLLHENNQLACGGSKTVLPMLRGKLLNGYQGFFNLDETAGTLRFNGVNATGVQGIVDILATEFSVKAKEGEKISIKAELSALAAANTFTDLLSLFLIEACEPTVIQGDVLGDGKADAKVNSTDALIVLTYDAGPTVLLMRTTG